MTFTFGCGPPQGLSYAAMAPLTPIVLQRHWVHMPLPKSHSRPGGQGRAKLQRRSAGGSSVLLAGESSPALSLATVLVETSTAGFSFLKSARSNTIETLPTSSGRPVQ
jgi:hypothetical protein